MIQQYFEQLLFYHTIQTLRNSQNAEDELNPLPKLLSEIDKAKFHKDS